MSPEVKTTVVWVESPTSSVLPVMVRTQLLMDRSLCSQLIASDNTLYWDAQEDIFSAELNHLHNMEYHEHMNYLTSTSLSFSSIPT